MVIKKDEATITKFVDSEYFSVYKCEVNGFFHIHKTKGFN